MEFCFHKRVLKYGSRVTASDDDVTYPPPSESEIQFHLWSYTNYRRVFVPDKLPKTQRTVDVASGDWHETITNVDRLWILNDNNEDDDRGSELYRLIYSELQRYNEYLREECFGQVLDRFVLLLIKELRDFVWNSVRPWEIKVVKLSVGFTLKHVCYERFLVQRRLLARVEKLARLYLDDKNDDDSDDDDDEEEEEEEKCAVCLEDLIAENEDVKILYMPCCHRFHGRCILKWLDLSRLCPICRFEMPIQP